MTTQPNYMSVAFTKEELDWLHWIMTQVITSEDINSSAKEKIIKAHELLAEVQEIVAKHKDVAASKTA